MHINQSINHTNSFSPMQLVARIYVRILLYCYCTVDKEGGGASRL